MDCRCYKWLQCSLLKLLLHLYKYILDGSLDQLLSTVLSTHCFLLFLNAQFFTLNFMTPTKVHFDHRAHLLFPCTYVMKVVKCNYPKHQFL